MLRLIGHLVHRLGLRGRERLAYRMLAGALVRDENARRRYDTR